MIFSSRKVIAMPSWMSSRPNSGVPVPVMSFTASVTMSEPMVPGSAPMTPPAAQLGTSPGAGASGCRSR